MSMTEYSSHSLNSLKGVIWRIIWGSAIAIINGDARTLDYGSYTEASSRARAASGILDMLWGQVLRAWG